MESSEGNLILTIIEAELPEGAALMKMKPFCRIKYGEEVIKTDVQTGHKPLWNQRYELVGLNNLHEI